MTNRIHTTAGSVAYDETGSGDTVVLLHATLHDRHDFASIVPVLAERHRVLALDWPAHGESDPAPNMTAERIGDVLAEVAAALDLRRAVFIGNSVGGYAAARLAIEHPDRVAGLVLVNSGGFIPPSPLVRAFTTLMGTPWVTRRVMPRFIRGYMRSAAPADDAIIERATALARTPAGIETAASVWRSFSEPAHDLRDRAHLITAPTLVVWGTKDIAIPARVGRATQEAITGSTLHEMPTGHVVFSSAPAEFLDLVLPFLASVAVDGASNG